MKLKIILYIKSKIGLAFQLFLSWLPSFKKSNYPQLNLRICLDQSMAREVVPIPNHVALIGGKDKYKWIQMKCPCGCGETLALNLMPTHAPKWKISIESPRSFSIHPSVHSMNCGAHFWVREGNIIWCDQ